MLIASPQSPVASTAGVPEIRMDGVRLVGHDGDGIELAIAGYQFPDAEDPRERHSWHVIVGRATCPRGGWAFRYPALTCEESTQIAPWLRAVAGSEDVRPLRFVEPNLGFALDGRDGPDLATVRISLDLELRPPWDPSNRAGHPFDLRLQVGPDQLLAAAADWTAQLARFPDRPS